MRTPLLDNILTIRSCSAVDANRKKRESDGNPLTQLICPEQVQAESLWTVQDDPLPVPSGTHCTRYRLLSVSVPVLQYSAIQDRSADLKVT